MRCFIAVEPAESVKRALWEHTQEVWGGLSWLRLTPESNLHLTLRFLGELTEEAAAAAAKTMTCRLAGAGPAMCALEGYGVFPKPRAPRILWVGMTDCRSGQLAEWRGAADAAAEAAGCPPDDKAFVPHITVGRFKEDCVARVVQQRLERVPTVAADAFIVNTVSLWSSELLPSGPRYAKLREVLL